MKLTWNSSTTGQVGFHVAELGEYDAEPPVRALLLDHAPTSINLEREAIAAYLAFGRWTSGDLTLPHKLGPNTAHAIESDMKHVSIRPNPIEYYPKPLELGIRTVRVSFTDATLPASRSAITVLDSSEWNGSVRGLRSIAVGANAVALDRAASTDFEQIRARLAVAVLFAGDLSADVLDVVGAQGLPSSERKRLEALLLAARLGVRFSED